MSCSLRKREGDGSLRGDNHSEVLNRLGPRLSLGELPGAVTRGQYLTASKHVQLRDWEGQWWNLPLHW